MSVRSGQNFDHCIVVTRAKHSFQTTSYFKSVYLSGDTGDYSKKKAARKAEKARLLAERQGTRFVRLSRLKNANLQLNRFTGRLMPLTNALTLLKSCCAALVVDGRPQLLAVNIREAMLNDIRQSGLGISMKTMRRCLRR